MLSLIRRLGRLVDLGLGKSSEVEIVCLAWSRKQGGRCLAGLRTDGGGWVRPVGDGLDEALPDNMGVALLDLLHVRLAGACPKPHQPENWRLRRSWYDPWRQPCRRVGRLKPDEWAASLEAQAYTGVVLLGSRDDRVSEGQFLATPAEASLALIKPENLCWLIVTGRSGKRQARAVFHWGGTAYNLAVTDPLWEQRLSGLTLGSHEHTTLCGPGRNVYLTISLSEPFNGYCYKLVAGIISL